MSIPSPSPGGAKNATWWQRLLHTEPAVVKGAISLLVALALIWGLDLTDLGERLKATADILGSLVTLLAPLWIRQSVYSPKTVEELVSKAAATGVPAVPEPPSNPETAEPGVVIQPEVDT